MSFGITELLIILVIVVLLFGTRKLRNMGGDLGSAIRSFRKAVNEPEPPAPPPEDQTGDKLQDKSAEQGQTIDVTPEPADKQETPKS